MNGVAQGVGVVFRAWQGVSGPASPTVRFVVDLRMCYRVRGVQERPATGKLLGAQSLPELGLGAIPAVSRPRADAEDSESFVVLQWGRCGGCGCSSCGGAVWLRRRRGVAAWRGEIIAAARVEGARWWEVRYGRVTG